MRKARCATPTEFGKEMRKLRIDRGETMKDTCLKLGVTQAYISHMENGKCQVPDGFDEKVITAYKLSGEEAQNLRKAAVISKNRYVIITKTNLQKKVAYELCNNIDKLSDDELAGIIDFIEESLQLRELTKKKCDDKQSC